MLQATYGDRSSIPSGIWSSQKDIGSPNPAMLNESAEPRWAAAISP
jgi:hypothetical protein